MVHRFGLGLDSAYYYVKHTAFGRWYFYDGNDKSRIIGIMNPKSKLQIHISKVKSINDFSGMLVLISDKNISHDEMVSGKGYAIMSPPVNRIIKFQ